MPLNTHLQLPAAAELQLEALLPVLRPEALLRRVAWSITNVAARTGVHNKALEH